MRFFLIPLLLLSACATPQEIEAQRQQQEQADIRQCVDLGFRPGTDAFAECRLRMVEMRADARNAARYSTHVGVGSGYYGPHRYRNHWGIGHAF